MPQKIPIEKIKEIYKNKGLLLDIDTYLNTTTPCCFTCEICNFYQKNSVPRDLVHKNLGCSNCSGNRKKTKEEIENFYLYKNLMLLEDYTKTQDRLETKCLICEHTWKAKFNKIQQGQGCPNCYKLSIRKLEDIIKIYKDKNLELLSTAYKNSNTRYKTKCLKCNFVWNVKPRYIIEGSKCPKCIKHLKLSKEEINNKFIKLGFELLEINYKKTKDRNLTRCLNCNYEWKVLTHNILHGGGCPKCHSSSCQKIVYDTLKEYLPEIEFFWNYSIKNEESPRGYYFIDIAFKHNNKIFYIEYNGQQHYTATRFGSMTQEMAEDALVKQKIRDQWLREYCIFNKIVLIEIDGRIFNRRNVKNFILDFISSILIENSGW